MSPNPDHPYKIGDPLVTTGQHIAKVVGQSNSSGVYITAEGHVRWEYYADFKVPDRLQPAIQNFEDMAQIIRRTFRESERLDAKRELASALRAALETPPGANPLEAMQAAEASLSGQYVSRAAVRYALGGTVAAIILVGLLWLTQHLGPSEAELVAFSAIAGALGAMISVLLRSRNLQVSASPLWYWVLEGSFRILLGVLFGGFIAVLIRGNIVLGIASQNAYVCYTIAVVAGFSERLVPNILKSIEEKQLKKAKKAK